MNRSKKNHMSEYAQRLQQALDAKQYELFLNAMCVEAARLSSISENQGILTGSRELDDLCAQAALALAQEFPLAPSGPVDEDLTLYIATDLYWGKGGHTPLLMDLIKVDRSARKELILTVVGAPPKSTEFSQSLRQALPPDVPAMQLHSDSLVQKIQILRSYIQQKRPRRIILVTHQYDVISYCGLTADCASQIIYIYHADTFTLGLHIPWYILVGTNYQSSRIVANEFGRGIFCWPVAAEDHGQRPWVEWELGASLNTCSHGTERKFEGRNGCTYAELVVLRLQSLPGNHYHIGSLGDANLNNIQQHIQAAGLDVGRFIYIGMVPSLWKFLKESPIQLCISSFPICSPKGLVETKGCGIPILIFEDVENPTRSSIQFAYKNCLFWNSMDDLCVTLKSLDGETLQQQALWARADYEHNHSLESLARCAAIPDTYVSPSARYPSI